MKNSNRIGLAWRRGLECAELSPRDKDQLDVVFVAQVVRSSHYLFTYCSFTNLLTHKLGWDAENV